MPGGARLGAGRKPKPLSLRILEGNPGHRPLPKNEPKPRPVAPPCPVWLLPAARREWRRVVPELLRLGLLTVVDRAALAGYCQAWAKVEAAERAIARNGLMTEDGKARPEVGIAAKEWAMIRAFCAEFGLTPAARTRMAIAREQETDDLLD